MKKIGLFILFILLNSLALGQARVQFIHNSPDLAADLVSVFIGNNRLFDSISFRQASPYYSLPSNQSLTISIQSVGINDTVESMHRETFSFEKDSSYILVIQGIISPSAYDSLKPFDLVEHSSRLEARQSGYTDILLFNGGIDMPAFDVNELTIPQAGFIDSLPYSEFTPYLELVPQDYEWELAHAFNEEPIAIYSIPLNSMGLADSSFVLMVSGFVDSLQGVPGDSSGGTPAPLVGLWAAMPSGGNLIELPVISNISLVERGFGKLSVFPVPVSDRLNIINDHDFGKRLKVNLIKPGGKVIYSQVIDNYGQDVFGITLSGIDQGFYIISVKDKHDRELVKKIFVK